MPATTTARTPLGAGGRRPPLPAESDPDDRWATPKEAHPSDLPAGVEAQVRPRSGLSLKKGITVLNSPGTIDADYRGEIGVILINLSNETVVIEHGERVAQLVFARHESIQWEESETLEETSRGEGGFGSTGVN